MSLQDVALRRAAAVVPTFVVTAGRDKNEMTAGLVAQVVADGSYTRMYVFDNESTSPYAQWPGIGDAPGVTVIPWPGSPRRGDDTIHAMWNLAMNLAAEEAQGPHNVLITNNDVRLVHPGNGESFLGRMSRALRSDDRFGAVYPNWSRLPLGRNQILVTEGTAFHTRGMSGWCFMLRGELGLRVDTDRFKWWCGDDQLELLARSDGRMVGCVSGVTVDHLEAGKGTPADDPAMTRVTKADVAAFVELYGADYGPWQPPALGAGLPGTVTNPTRSYEDGAAEFVQQHTAVDGPAVSVF